VIDRSQKIPRKKGQEKNVTRQLLSMGAGGVFRQQEKKKVSLGFDSQKKRGLLLSLQRAGAGAEGLNNWTLQKTSTKKQRA